MDYRAFRCSFQSGAKIAKIVCVRTRRNLRRCGSSNAVIQIRLEIIAAVEWVSEIIRILEFTCIEPRDIQAYAIRVPPDTARRGLRNGRSNPEQQHSLCERETQRQVRQPQ